MRGRRCIILVCNEILDLAPKLHFDLDFSLESMDSLKLVGTIIGLCALGEESLLHCDYGRDIIYFSSLSLTR